MKAVIFANGVLNTSNNPIVPYDGDLIIAADGGARNCKALGLTPDIVIGDMDSLDREEIKDLEKMGVEIIRHPVHKDYTDLQLAIQLAVERGADDILILAALGERWDMTLANIMLLALSDIAEANVRLIDGPDEVNLQRGPSRFSVHGKPGDIVSFVPISDKVEGVYLRNLRYPLTNATVIRGSTLCLSNVMLGNKADIEIGPGIMICIVRRS